MEVIHGQGFEVGGLCGGACANCYVGVATYWAPKLLPGGQ
jgi:hypothetical protein